jgi:hypothetical protein
MEAVRTSETSVDDHFTRQYIPEDNSEHFCETRSLDTQMSAAIYFPLQKTRRGYCGSVGKNTTTTIQRTRPHATLVLLTPLSKQ